MAAIILTIRFDTKWILNNVTSEKMTLIDDVIKTLKKDVLNNHITVINKDLQQCRAMLISKEAPDKEQIDKMIRDELKVIDESVRIDISIENLTKENVHELMQDSKSLSEEDNKVLEDELGITVNEIDNQQDTEIADEPTTKEKNENKSAENKNTKNTLSADNLIGIRENGNAGTTTHRYNRQRACIGTGNCHRRCNGGIELEVTSTAVVIGKG